MKMEERYSSVEANSLQLELGLLSLYYCYICIDEGRLVLHLHHLISFWSFSLVGQIDNTALNHSEIEQTDND